MQVLNVGGIFWSMLCNKLTFAYILYNMLIIFKLYNQLDAAAQVNDLYSLVGLVKPS